MRRRLDKTSSPFKWNVLMEKRVLCMTIRHDDDKCKYVRDWAVADRRDRWITENDDRDDARVQSMQAPTHYHAEKIGDHEQQQARTWLPGWGWPIHQSQYDQVGC